jgi:hypothetical protein
MIEREQMDELIMEALVHVHGIVEVSPLAEEDRQNIGETEREAENNSLMGLGKVINMGVRKVLESDRIYVALTDMEFDWGCRPNLLMKKGDEIVGQEITDQQAIERLSEDKNAWFMHRNFVVYKDKITFPQDVMNKICYFEIPSHPADWSTLDRKELHCYSFVYGSPSTPCDILLKDRYFQGLDKRGFGTVLIGVMEL